jgi:hypothetical protein
MESRLTLVCGTRGVRNIPPVAHDLGLAYRWFCR